MEVHHHAHTSRRKWTHYFWEFLMLFAAVTLGFYAENIREHILHEKAVKSNMRSLLSDLRSDVSLFDSILHRNAYSAEMSDSLIEYLHNNLSNTPDIYYFARVTTANLGYFYANSKSFDQLKSAGLLRYVKSRELLDSIGGYYVSFQWLANQTELIRFKVDAIHKGNAELFDSYIFNQMMKVDFRANSRLPIIKPPDNPALLTTDYRIINAVSLNYHYYSTSAKFYNRTAARQINRAKRLIRLIEKEYRLSEKTPWED